jgi:hypothetical protein
MIVYYFVQIKIIYFEINEKSNVIALKICHHTVFIILYNNNLALKTF